MEKTSFQICTHRQATDFLTLMPSSGYILSNNHHIELKVVFWESEEHFTHYRFQKLRPLLKICNIYKDLVILLHLWVTLLFNLLQLVWTLVSCACVTTHQSESIWKTRACVTTMHWLENQESKMCIFTEFFCFQFRIEGTMGYSKPYTGNGNKRFL